MLRKFITLVLRISFIKNLAYKCYVAAYNEAGALKMAKILHQRSCGIIFNILGESAKDKGDAIHFAREYTGHIKNIAALKEETPGIRLALSIKPSQFGLKFDEEFSLRIARKLLDDCLENGVIFEIDMEGPELIEATTEMAKKLARQAAERGHNVRLAIQANQETPLLELKELFRNDVAVRIVKGAYPGKLDDEGRINSRFQTIAYVAKGMGADAALGTHDKRLIRCVRSVSPQTQVQMLFGVRPFTKKDWVYMAWGTKEEAERFFARRMGEGVRPNVFPLFALNFFEALLWRAIYCPKTLLKL